MRHCIKMLMRVYFFEREITLIYLINLDCSSRALPVAFAVKERSFGAILITLDQDVHYGPRKR